MNLDVYCHRAECRIAVVLLSADACVAAACFCCYTDCIASVLKVEGGSMRPTLNPDSTGPSDWVLVEKLSVKLQRCYTRGEVVVLW
jgi:signal peptidase I